MQLLQMHHTLKYIKSVFFEEKKKPTVVLLHVGPKVFFFYAVGKRAVPDVQALLASCHVHADLKERERV